MHQGWIKLYRRLLNHPRSNNPHWMALFVRLLLSADHSGNLKRSFRGREISLHPGQLLTSRLTLANQTGLSEWQVERLLGAMRRDGEIAQQSDNRSRLISITNWEVYQGVAQPDSRSTQPHSTLDGTFTEPAQQGAQQEGSVEPMRTGELPLEATNGAQPSARQSHGNRTTAAHTQELEEEKKIRSSSRRASKASVLVLSDEDAEEIYREYPRKVHKVEALEAIKKAGRSYPKAVLMEGVRRFATDSIGQDPKFICLAATFFNKKRFLPDDETDRKPAVSFPKSDVTESDQIEARQKFEESMKATAAEASQ